MSLPNLAARRFVLLSILACAACADCGEDGTQGVAAAVVPSSDAIAFGGVFLGATAVKEWQLRAVGSGSVTVASLALEGDPAFTLAAGSEAGFTIGRGNSGRVELTYQPFAVGPNTATLVVRTDLEATPELRVAITGEGLAPRSCDDHEDCTTDAFDPVTGACVNTRREGACDDANACTADDVCVDARCLGRALDCADDSECTRDLCDARSGCVSITDPAACDDENPCTAESCDADGCHHDDVANGTPCGAITGCRDVPICLFGRCERFDAPDGTPCFDGDACTTADTCRGGECAGTRETRAPAVTATLSTFGTPLTDTLVLGDARVLFSHRLDGSGERVLTLVEQRGGALVVLDERVVPAHTLLAASGAATFTLLQASTPPALTVYTITGAGRLVERGHAEFVAATAAAAVGSEGLLVLCGELFPRGQVQAWSLTDPDHPVLASEFGTCAGPVDLDDRTRRVFVGSTFVDAWNLTDPAAPTLAGTIVQPDGEFFLGPRAARDGLFLTHAIRANQSLLRAFDAATLAPVGELPAGNGASLQIGARRAFLSGAGVPVRVFDFTNPSAPTEVPAAAAAGLAGRLVVGKQLVVTGFHGSDQRVFEHGGTPFALTARAGRSQGRLSSLVARPWGLQSVSDVASHLFDLTTPDAPRLDAGGPFPSTSALVGLGATGGAPFVVQPLFWPHADTLLGQNPYGFSPDGGVWTGAANASEPLVLGTVPYQVWGAIVDGHLLVNADRYYRLDAVSLATRDFATLVPAFPSVLPPAALFPLEPVESTPTVRSSVTMQYFAAAPTGRRLAVAVNRDTFSGPAPQRAVRIWQAHLVDLEDPAHGTELLSFAGTESIAAIATDGQAVAVLEARLPLAEFDRDRTPSTLRIARQQNATPSVIEIPGGHRISWFDGRVAFVLTPDGVTVVDVVGAPRILGTVALPEHPIDARVVGDRLVVASESRLSVVSPPCPPIE